MENKSKKLNFADVTIDTSALFCPNAEEFFARSYIEGLDPANFRTIPGVKTTASIANLNFGSTLRAEGCDVVESTGSLSAKTITVVPFDYYKSFCKKELEASFVAKQMKAGSQNWNNVPAFMGEVYSTLSEKINEELQYLAWIGDPNDSSFSGDNAFKALATGWRKRITGATGSIVSAATPVTTTNVINLIGNLLQALPARVISKKKEVRIYAASNVCMSYRIATTATNTNTNVTGELPLAFNGIPIIECATLPNNNICVTRYGNLIYAFDGMGEADSMKTIDLSNTTGAKRLLLTGCLKAGFDIVNGPEFAMYF